MTTRRKALTEVQERIARHTDEDPRHVQAAILTLHHGAVDMSPSDFRAAVLDAASWVQRTSVETMDRLAASWHL